MTILHVDSSITGDHSVSRRLSAAIVERLAAQGQHEIIYRDVVAEALPHFTAVTAPSAHPMAQVVTALDETQQMQRSNSDAILREFMDAETIVLGVPMYNFTIPSELKAWIDRLIVPGTTFRRGDAGPEGLAQGKRVILAVARGGIYSEGSSFAAAEHAESLLRSLLGFIGINHIETVTAEGLNFPEIREQAVSSAMTQADKLAA